MMKDSYYLEISHNYVKFDAGNQITKAFYDDNKQQIFSVRGGGGGGGTITVKELGRDSQTFCLDSTPSIIAIKFSPENDLLAIHRTETSIVIYLRKDQQLLSNPIYYEVKNTKIYGFFWSLPNEIVIISSDTIDLYYVNSLKRLVKPLKSLQISSMFMWYRSSFVVLSSNGGKLLTPILVKQGNLQKLPCILINDGPPVKERDIHLGLLYGIGAIMILKVTRNQLLEIVIYLLNGPGLAPIKSHILKLGLSGRVAVNIIDNVIIVHHQATATSMLFDIALPGEPDPKMKSVIIHTPLVPAKSIKPMKIKLPSIPLKENSMDIELYSSDWVLFLPNIIIETKLGYMFELMLNIEPLCMLIGDRVRLIDFLLKREKSVKDTLLNVVSQLFISPDGYGTVSLHILEVIFNQLNCVYKVKVENDLQAQMTMPTVSSPINFQIFPIKASSSSAIGNSSNCNNTGSNIGTTNVTNILNNSKIIVEQSDILRLFLRIENPINMERIVLVYIHSLIKNGISCDYDLSKTLVMNLINSENYLLLQQILSYNVLHESKPLACLLLSLCERHRIISQMALDMLRRLNANDIIVEILLERGDVISAIRLAKQYNNVDQLLAHKYLEVAVNNSDKDKMSFYAVYQFFIARNQRLRGTTEFLKSEQCDEFVRKYQELFPT